jgi:uncharacterized NAD(P)/FAD-binding protein YdhS
MKIQFTSQIFREARMYVAYSPRLDLSSCATTEARAQKNLVEAVRLFLEEAEKKGSLQQILRKPRCTRRGQRQLTGEILTALETTLTVAP